MNIKVLAKPELLEESTICSRQPNRTSPQRMKKRFPRLTIGADSCCSILGRVAPTPAAETAAQNTQSVLAGSLN
jgi:hypothetical protein